MAPSTKIPLTDKDISDLKAKHKHILQFALERGGQIFVARSPDPDEFQRSLDKSADGGKAKVDAMTELGECCIVFPDEEVIRATAEEMPGLYFTAGGKALELAGVTDGYNVKKL